MRLWGARRLGPAVEAAEELPEVSVRSRLVAAELAGLRSLAEGMLSRGMPLPPVEARIPGRIGSPVVPSLGVRTAAVGPPNGLSLLRLGPAARGSPPVRAFLTADGSTRSWSDGLLGIRSATAAACSTSCRPTDARRRAAAMILPATGRWWDGRSDLTASRASPPAAACR